MNLKTSLFNKSIIKSDFKRFWWCGALYFLMIFLVFTFVYLEFVFSAFTPNGDMFYQTRFINLAKGSVSLSYFFPIGLATLLFSYLNSSQAVSCLHGLPVKRRTFFASHILSGSLLLVLPIILNALILIIFRVNPIVSASYRLLELFNWGCIFTIYSLLIFYGASMVSLICANNVATIIFTYIFAGLPAVAEIFCVYFLDEHLYGFAESNAYSLSAFLYHAPSELFQNGWLWLEYIIFAIIFLVLAFFFYKKRKLEYNAEIVAFPKLKPVFVYGVGICSGALGYAYLTSFFPSKNILLLIPFGILGIVIAEMIAKKTLKPKKVLKPIAIFSLAIVILQFSFQIDITGFERRIPNPQKIASVSYSDGMTNTYRYKNYSNYGEEIYYDEESDFSFYEESEIERVLSLHEELITNRTSYNGTEIEMTPITISYTLKNGRTLTRDYLINYEVHKEFLESIIESEQIRKMYFPILREHHKDYISLRVSDNRLNSSGITYLAGEEIFNKLYNALTEDAKNTDYDEFASRTDELTEIHLYYTKPAKYEDGSPVPTERLPETQESYKIRSDYKNTLAVLEEIGYYNNLPSYRDIKLVGVDFYMSGKPYVMTESTDVIEPYAKGKYAYHKFTEDKEIIKEVYEFMCENYSSFSTYDSNCVLELGTYNISFGYNSKAENIPEFLKQ